MIKISVQNLKGGTGKTSTVVNLGHALALQGKKVLLIDTDTLECLAPWSRVPGT